MEQDVEYRAKQVQAFKKDVEPLLRYLPWLEQHAGKNSSVNYSGDSIGANSLAFPVYDSQLLGFVKEASRGGLMDRNYQYVYTRNQIHGHDDERRLIASATIRDWEILKGILSYYCLGGRTKSSLWSEAVQESIFSLVVGKMKEIIEYWDKPF